MDESFAETMALMFFIQGVDLCLQRRHFVLIQSHCCVGPSRLLWIVGLDSRIDHIVVATGKMAVVVLILVTSEAAWFNAKHDRNESEGDVGQSL